MQRFKVQIKDGATRIGGRNFMSQQDDASVYKVIIARDFFKSLKIKLFFPDLHPDLDIVENY